MIDHYCERTGPGLWQEPLNVTTNIAFFIVAILAFVNYRKRRGLKANSDYGYLALVFLLLLIGIGSSLFHLLANAWSELADSLPILGFITLYLILYLRRFTSFNLALIILSVLLFHVANTAIIFFVPRQTLNGSLFYLPAWISLALFTLSHFNPQIRGVLRQGLLIFTVSLFFRSVDMQVCPYFPIGTHFLWHILNAWLLYILINKVYTSKQLTQHA